MAIGVLSYLITAVLTVGMSLLVSLMVARKNKKIDIIVGDEDEENLAELTAAEEIALTNLIKKSSPRSNNILILLENQKIKMKLENPYSNNGKIETIKMEFGEERNASKNPIEKTEI